MIKIKTYTRKPKADIYVRLIPKDEIESIRDKIIGKDIVENSKLTEDTYFYCQKERTLYYILNFEKYDMPYIENVMGDIARILGKFNAKTVCLMNDINVLSYKAILETCIGFLLGAYSPTIIISTNNKEEIICKADNPVKTLYVPLDKEKEELTKRAMTYAMAVHMVRDFVNTPANHCTPNVLADSIADMAKVCKLDYTCYTRSSPAVQDMGGLLAVAEGSDNEPYVIKLKYKSSRTSKPKTKPIRIGLVGKGVTYDTGGLNIKPGSSMVKMKSDKAGALSIVGVMYALSILNLPNLEVEAVLGLVENSIGGGSYRPGDIVTMKNGKTVEITNTDAEGRLVLADCLTLLQESKEKFDIIIDIATLTGSCVTGLGPFITGVISNETSLAVKYCNNASMDTSWPLPFDGRLTKYVEASDIADLVNAPECKGDAISAAIFLSNFVDVKTSKWLHLDICGPAFVNENCGFLSKGATGAGVIGLLHFIIGLSLGEITLKK